MAKNCSCLDVQLAAWNITEVRLHNIYFPVNFLKLVTTTILPWGNCNQLLVKLTCPLYGNTSPISIGYVLVNAIMYDAHQNFNIWSFWYPLFYFRIGSFFLLKITLNPNYGLKNQDNLHLFSTSPSFRIEDLGIGISVLYPNHLIWYLLIETPFRQNSLRISPKYL